MNKLQKIKDWISKEQEGLMDENGNFEFPEHEGAYHILCNLDAYIDSLQEEPASRNPADIEAAMQEVEEKSKAFTDAHQGENTDTILAQMQGEEPVSNDLEAAAKNVGQKYFPDEYNIWARPNYEAVKAECAFMDGAKWQKEQLITKAIDMTVGYWMPNGLRLDVDETENPYNIDEGNKVKLIIIKDE